MSTHAKNSSVDLCGSDGIVISGISGEKCLNLVDKNSNYTCLEIFVNAK